MRKSAITLVAGMAALGVFAEVKLATPFASSMVLQREMKVPVWGEADPGEKVRVSFAGQTLSTVADERGAWKVYLEPMKSSKESRELKVNDITLKDVLVGEVWICSGQSNTEMPLSSANPHFQDINGRLTSAMANNKFIRLVHASNYQWSTNAKKRASYPVEWKHFIAENFAFGAGGKSFSAMGAYFAKEIYAAIDVPVAVIGCYWGGTNIDAWTPREAYASFPELKSMRDWTFISKEAWTSDCVKHPVSAAHKQPTVLWNEMVEPWCPMACRGMLWYQGCSNNGEGDLYRIKMHALYKGWSEKFENPGLKLYFVQLAPWQTSWWGIQLAQARFAEEEKNAGMVVTADVGNSDDIHPAHKFAVGQRLAALALNRDYGMTSLVADSPVLKDIISEEGRLIMRFKNAEGWYIYNPDFGVQHGFEIAGADGVWKKARIVNAGDGETNREKSKSSGTVAGRDIILEADGVDVPSKVRYLYSAPWFGTLYSNHGLPLGPFEAEVK